MGFMCHTLCHKALPAGARKHVGRALPLSGSTLGFCTGWWFTPFILLLPDAATSSVHVYCCGQVRCSAVPMWVRARKVTHTFLCVKSTLPGRNALFLLCYVVLSGNICSHCKATGGCRVTAFLLFCAPARWLFILNWTQLGGSLLK